MLDCISSVNTASCFHSSRSKMVSRCCSILLTAMLAMMARGKVEGSVRRGKDSRSEVMMNAQLVCVS